jgi:predicted proteasome-type protease
MQMSYVGTLDVPDSGTNAGLDSHSTFSRIIRQCPIRQLHLCRGKVVLVLGGVAKSI